MRRSLVRQAAELYKKGDYRAALNSYHELARLLGDKSFHANIQLTEKKIARTQSSHTPLLTIGQTSTPVPDQRAETILATPSGILPNFVTLQCTRENQQLVLSDVPVWCQFELSEDDYVRVSAEVDYEEISPENNRKAIAVVEYMDASENVIPGPYLGLTKSDSVGWFHYLSPLNRGGTTLALRPPSGTSFVRIGFRTYYARLPERVKMAPRIGLRWHDNAPCSAVGKTATSSSPTLAVLPFEMPVNQAHKRLTVASVLDPFSHACFEPECDLIPINPSRWRDELIDRHIDLVLVESAWHGNGDAWQYRVAKYPSAPGNELSELLRWARRTGVPTVFWNKEDPPNFDRFIDRAAEFDYIFTTDENCIERYRRHVPASTYVGILPFAAQPRIHNPRLDQPRINATSFAGTYYADDFEPRRRAMDMLLRVAARYGLDIFDRMHDVTGKDKDRFAFPTDLQPYIRGSLAYEEMVKAYRRYRVGLNVNSVSDSPTMFSRRVFELLACGTPVMSTESRGIDHLFDGLVLTVESEAEAVQAFNALMEDPAHWLKTSVRGLRAVFTRHTYAHRLQTVANAVGLHVPDGAESSPVVVVRPLGDANRFAASMRQQDLSAVEIIVVGASYQDEKARLHVDALRAVGRNATALPASNIVTYVRHRYPEAIVAVCDSRHHYGPAYLLDASIALRGTQRFGASTILPDADPIHGATGLSFEAAARVGLPSRQLFSGTLVAWHDSPLLFDALTYEKGEDVFDIDTCQIWTRAGFDFIPCSALNAGYDVNRADLR